MPPRINEKPPDPRPSPHAYPEGHGTSTPPASDAASFAQRQTSRPLAREELSRLLKKQPYQAPVSVPEARSALFMPALIAARFNPDLKSKYQQMVAAGKPAKVAITTLMRKLVVTANALLKADRLWQQSRA